MSKCRFASRVTSDLLGACIRPRLQQVSRDKTIFQRRHVSDSIPPTSTPTRGRRALYIAGGLLILGGGAVSVSDEARHLYRAAQRSGRVVSTLYLCMQEYAHMLELIETYMLTIPATGQF